MLSMGFKPGAAGWYAQTDSLSYGGQDLGSNQTIHNIYKAFKKK